MASIDETHVHPLLRECRFHIACDVTNPLCGDRGCSAIYGPQKGARPSDILVMDATLARYAALSADIHPDCDPDHPGAGAAGGLGFAFRTYLNARLTPGVDLILQMTELEAAIAKADLVITGEGRLDAQTSMGKAPAGVAALAKKHGKRTIALSGCLGEGASACNACGIDAFFPILPACMTIEEAMEHDRAYSHLANTAEQIFRLIGTFS